MRQDAFLKTVLVLILIALIANLGLSLFKVDEAKAQARTDRRDDTLADLPPTSEATAIREVATAIQGLARSMDSLAKAVERGGSYTRDVAKANQAIAEAIRVSAASTRGE